ncbi:MAG: asparagine synthase-related protein [Desulfovibrionaceae bacterium]
MDCKFLMGARRDWKYVEENGKDVWVCGWAEADGALLDATDLAGMSCRALREGKFDSLPLKLHGSFALACCRNGECLLVTDAVRSIPLFWRAGDGEVLAGDDPDLLCARELPLDESSAEEFLAAGFVTGNATLREGLRGVQAGQHATISDDEVSLVDYYEYRCTYDDSRTELELADEHDAVIMRAMERVVRSTGGRQLVVPLSGGLDSRMVASCLARLGRDNVLCYTYGLPGNAEARKSEEVAASLGLPWLHVEYDPHAVRTAMADEQYREYRRFASSQVSSPHIDEWFALQRLDSEGLVDKDAVFLPGHTGDFICGGHLKHLFDPAHNENPHAFAEAMLRKHYSLWEDHVRKAPVRALLLSRLECAAGQGPLDSPEGLAAAYEFWEWRERQAKFIINAVRAYEWFGFDWRLPLWDRELMEFWKGVPLGLKHEKYLYRLALVRHDPFGVFAGEALAGPWDAQAALDRFRARKRGVRRRLKRALLGMPGVRCWAERRSRIRRLEKQYASHPLGIVRCWDRDEYVRRHIDKRHHQSLITLAQLEEERGPNNGSDT